MNEAQLLEFGYWASCSLGLFFGWLWLFGPGSVRWKNKHNK